MMEVLNESSELGTKGKTSPPEPNEPSEGIEKPDPDNQNKNKPSGGCKADKLSPNDHFDTLPVKLTAAQIIIRDENINGSQEDVALFCVPHDRADNVLIPAFGFCVNCEEHLCEDCIMYHKKAKPSQNHVILGKDKMPTSRDGTKPPVDVQNLEPIRCNTHKDKDIEFYCAKHNVVLCYVCSTLQHASCKIDFIPDISVQYTQGREFQAKADRIEAQIVATIELCKSKQKVEEENEAEMMATAKKIEAFKGEINETLNLLEQKVKQAADEERQKNNNKLKEMEQTFANIQNEKSQLRATFDRLKNPKDHDRLFIDILLADQKIDEYESELYAYREACKVENYMFVPNEMLRQTFATETRLGYVSSGEGDLPPTPPPEACSTPTEGKPSLLWQTLAPSRSNSAKKSKSFRQKFLLRRDN